MAPKFAFVEITLINPEILRKSRGNIRASIAVSYTLELLDVDPSDVLRKRGDARSKYINYHTDAIVATAEFWENPREPVGFRGTIVCYYCGNCGTPLKPGKCSGCDENIVDIKAIRQNEATTMPRVAYDQITWKNNPGDGKFVGRKRYEFQKEPRTVTSPRKPLPPRP